MSIFKTLRIALPCSLLALTLSACSENKGSAIVAENNVSRQQWQQTNIESYVLDYRFLFFSGSDLPRYKVTVSNNVISGVLIYNSQGEEIESVPPTEFENYHDVPGLFDLVEARAWEADEVTATYDPEFGYPTRIYIDYDLNTTDDELSITNIEVTF